MSSTGTKTEKQTNGRPRAKSTMTERVGWGGEGLTTFVGFDIVSTYFLSALDGYFKILPSRGFIGR